MKVGGNQFDRDWQLEQDQFDIDLAVWPKIQFTIWWWDEQACLHMNDMREIMKNVIIWKVRKVKPFWPWHWPHNRLISERYNELSSVKSLRLFSDLPNRQQEAFGTHLPKTLNPFSLFETPFLYIQHVIHCSPKMGDNKREILLVRWKGKAMVLVQASLPVFVVKCF